MRLIDADALLKGKDDHQIISTHLIWNAPTVDAVRVVRCGECKHRCGHMDGYTECDRTERIRIWHPDDWYCAYGKRRKE